jgi:hypothetical protein
MKGSQVGSPSHHRAGIVGNVVLDRASAGVGIRHGPRQVSALLEFELQSWSERSSSTTEMRGGRGICAIR